MQYEMNCQTAIFQIFVQNTALLKMHWWGWAHKTWRQGLRPAGKAWPCQWVLYLRLELPGLLGLALRLLVVLLCAILCPPELHLGLLQFSLLLRDPLLLEVQLLNHKRRQGGKRRRKINPVHRAYPVWADSLLAARLKLRCTMAALPPEYILA